MKIPLALHNAQEKDIQALISAYKHKTNLMYAANTRVFSKIGLMFHKCYYHGLENKREKGRNIIVANHRGDEIDIAALMRLYDRRLYFAARKELFNQKDFIALGERELRRGRRKGESIWAEMKVTFFKPFTVLAANYFPKRIKRVGCIPVDIYNSNKGTVRKKIEEYLKDDKEQKAVILLQGAENREKSCFHPYINKFRRGSAVIAYMMYRKHGLDIPITPISIYGSERASLQEMLSLKKKPLFVNIGEPMFISDFVHEKKPVDSFNTALEQRIAELLQESLDRHGIIYPAQPR